MLFGAFFAAYFFLRVVADPAAWPPAGRRAAGAHRRHQHRGPGLFLVHGVVHHALEAIKHDNHRGLKLGLGLTWLLGATFLFIQINEYIHIGFTPRDGAFGSIFFSLTGLHGAHVFVGLLLLTFANIRAWRGHFSSKPEDHLGVEVPGIYWHFVDIMWIIVFVAIYVI